MDGLLFSASSAYFVEFKGGFKKRTRDNFDDRYAMCPQLKSFCKDYKEWFFEKQKKETEELETEIKFKAIESYLTFEKHILSLCHESECELKIVLVVVIDEDEIEDYESALLNLSENHKPQKVDKNNCFQSLRDSLKNYHLRGYTLQVLSFKLHSIHI